MHGWITVFLESPRAVVFFRTGTGEAEKTRNTRFITIISFHPIPVHVVAFVFGGRILARILRSVDTDVRYD